MLALYACVQTARGGLGVAPIGACDVRSVDPDLANPVGRQAAAGVRFDDPSLGVVLAGAGSSDLRANASVAAIAKRWSVQSGWSGAVAAFAAAVKPDVPAAIASLRARGASRIAVASWFLAPGFLPDRVYNAARAVDPSVVIAEPLGADPDVASLILHRYDEALSLERTG